MKSISRVLLAASLLCLVGMPFIPVLQEAMAQVPADTTPIGLTATVTFDEDGSDVDGNVEMLSHGTVALFAANTPVPILPSALYLASVKVPIVAGSNTASITALVTGRASGSYLLSVQAVDGAGNQSAWGVPIKVYVDVTSPKPPTGIKCNNG